MPEPQSPSKKWISFTPWKAGICLLSFGLWIITVTLLEMLIPGETEDAVTRQVNGGMEYTIKSLKGSTLMIIFIVSFFGYPTLLSWLFWDRLSEERNRIRGKPNDNSRGSLVGRIVGYGITGVLVAFILLIFVSLILIGPLTEACRITIRGDDVYVESLYRSWDISRHDIQQVDVTREVDDGRRAPYAEYRMVIRLKNGDQFRTASDVRARPPGGPEDRQYEKFFADLRSELTKN